MATEYKYGVHSGKGVTTCDKKDGKKFSYKDRWVEQYHGRDKSRRKYEPYNLNCTELAHFTDHTAANEIGNSTSGDFSFKVFDWDHLRKKSEKKLEENPKETHDLINYLTWWMAFRPDSWKTTVEGCIQDLKDNYEDVLGNSSAFNGANEYGPIGFVVSWENIRNEYAKSRGKKLADVDLRILGTFRYFAEIMYAILVCIKSDIIEYRTGNNKVIVSSMSENTTEAFENLDDKNFIWKVYSTIGYDNNNKRRPIPGVRWTWDHLSFAFYFPSKDDILKIPSRLFKIDDTKIGCSRYKHSEKKEARQCVDILRRKIEEAKLHFSKQTSEHREEQASNLVPVVEDVFPESANSGNAVTTDVDELAKSLAKTTFPDDVHESKQ